MVSVRTMVALTLHFCDNSSDGGHGHTREPVIQFQGLVEYAEINRRNATQLHFWNGLFTTERGSKSIIVQK